MVITTGVASGAGGDGGKGARGWVTTRRDGGRLLVALGGAWTVPDIETLRSDLRAIDAAGAAQAELDLTDITRLDSAGAYMIQRLVDRLDAAGASPKLTGMQDRHAPLFEIVRDSQPHPEEQMHDRTPAVVRFLSAIGGQAVTVFTKGAELCNFIGMVVMALITVIRHPSRLRPIAIVNQMELTGLRAIPIVALLSFLIGVTLAYLMGDQFKAYGLDVFTVNVLGIFVLREGAVLITAIVIAGRSGSAFTAEIGTMKVNEELDAMKTLGLDPIEVLVLPRILALIVTLPVLVFVADIAGLIGGGMMTMLVLDISPAQFMQQLKGAVGLDTFMVGMVKAPFHACIIAIVGCYEGFKVERSAESVGKQTTTSVVESIFLVIVATAMFSVLFSVLNI